MPTRPLMFACALLFAVALGGACTTEDVHPNVVMVASPNAGIAFFLIRDDAYNPDGTANYELPLYRVTVDGSYLTFNESTYVDVRGPTAAWDLPAPAGTHVVGLSDEQGHAVAASPAIETKPLATPPLPSYHPTVVFFGGSTSFRARVLIDDPAALPAGVVHLRVMNAFVDHRPLQVVQCLTDLDANAVVQTAGTCTPVGAPIAYGDAFETDAGADVVNKIGFSWDEPSTGDVAVQGINAGGPSGYVAGASRSFITRIPIQVLDPGSRVCPTCILASF